MKPLGALRALCGGELPALVLFDLDGTLIDSLPDITRALNRTLAAYDRPPVAAHLVRDWVGRGAAQLLADALAHGARGNTDEVTHSAALARYLQTYLDDCCRDTRPMPGAASLLEALDAAGVRLACVINKSAAISARVLAALGLDARFALVQGGDSGAGRKPDPGPLLRAMRVLGAPPARTLMIGDSRHDVEAARAAGVRVIAVRGGYNHGEDVAASAPDLLVASLGELL